MDIDTSSVISRIKSNKGWVVVGLVVLFVLYSFLSGLSGGYRSTTGAMYDESGYAGVSNYGMAQKSMALSRESASFAPSPGSGGASASKPIVKRASLEVKSENAKADESKITDRAKSIGGFLEGVSDSNTEDYLTVTVSVKVPSAKFDDFVAYLRDNFNVKSSSIDLYRISLKQETDELAILQNTMDAYNDLFKRAEGNATLDSQTLAFLADLTDKKLYIMRLMRQYGYSLEEKQEDVDYSTLTLTLTEEKQVELVKEGFWANFRRQLRNSVESILDNLTSMVTDTLEIFVYVVKVGLILVVIAVPIRIVVKLLGRIFNIHVSSGKAAPEVPAAGRKRSGV